MQVPNEIFGTRLLKTKSEGSSEAGESNGNLVEPEINAKSFIRYPKFERFFQATSSATFPFLLVNIGSGVSCIKVTSSGQYERISGTCLGGGTLFGLLSMLTPATTFDEMLDLAEQGDHSQVDLLVSDIYGQSYSAVGLDSNTIASTFGKMFRKKQDKKPRPEDIAASLLYAISNNIGQLAYHIAKDHKLTSVYFSGFFLRGRALTQQTLSRAVSRLAFHVDVFG